MDEVYPPGEDTFLLMESALEEVKEDDEVLEVGSGTGVIAEKLKAIALSVIATDISPHAVRMTAKRGIDVVRTDLARGIKKKFSLILFNPPYLPLDEGERRGDWIERAIDGGENGREIILRFLREIKDNLADKGKILLLVSSLSGIKEILDFAEREGYAYEKVNEIGLFFERLEVYRLRLLNKDSKEQKENSLYIGDIH